MAFAYPWTGLTTLLSVLMIFWFGAQVAARRSVHDISAPATTGHPEFERYFRAHYNTLEQFALFLPSLWLFAILAGDRWAGLAGAVWIVGRLMFAVGYWQAPEKRLPGLGISLIPLFVTTIGALVFLVRSLVL